MFRCYPCYRGEKPNMLFEGSEIDQNALLLEGRHLVTDSFFCVRRGFSNRHPDLLQNLLKIIRETGNIVIDCLGYGLIGVHKTFAGTQPAYIVA